MFQKISNCIKGLFSKPAKSDNSIEIKMKLIELYLVLIVSCVVDNKNLMK